MITENKIALLIDCDNARPDAIYGIMNELAKNGMTNIRRAYGNWKNHSAWEEKLHPYALQPMQQFPYTKGKNATDIAMTIDAMELLFTEELDYFAIVTSDSDFTPLVMKILSKGKKVIGFGERKTPDPFVKCCSEFIYTENFAEPSKNEVVEIKTVKKTRNELKGDTELMNLLRNAIQFMKEENGWAFLGKIGQYVSNNSSISPSNYGFSKWSDLIRTTDYFDEKMINENMPYFRLKKQEEKVEAKTEKKPVKKVEKKKKK